MKAGCSLASLDPTVRGTNDSAVSNSSYESLSLGAEWAVTFPYGEMRGVQAFTETDNGVSPNSVGSPGNDIISSIGVGGTGYCWCRITQYTPDGGDTCSFTDTSWVLLSGTYQNVGGNPCPSQCAQQIGDFNGCDEGHPMHSMYTMMGMCNTEPDHSNGNTIRRALFGQSQ